MHTFHTKDGGGGGGERLGFEQFCVCTKQIIPKNLPTEGVKITVVCLSVSLSISLVFSSNCSIVFSDFWHDDR